jgi:PAS domain S-box-containing protein
VQDPRLINRVLSNRRSVIIVSLAALSTTIALAAFTTDPNLVGPAMLLPWVALFAFEAGPLLGLAVAALAFVLFMLTASADGFDVTAEFVFGRFMAFALIAVGVGIAGARLRRSEQRSRRLVEGLPLVMYVEEAGRLTYISPQIEALLGHSVSDWLTQRDLWRTVLHPDDRERVLDAYAEAVDTAGDFECTYRLVRPDSRPVWVRDSSAFVSDGPRSYRQGFIVDVTAQKTSEEAVERNSTLMRALIDGTVDGVTLTDRTGRVVIANRPLMRFVEELGIPHTGLMHERLLAVAGSVVDRERFERRMHELAAAPDVESADEFELDGGDRAFQGFTRPVIGADNAYLGRVWTLREVTEARQVDRIKDAIVATVSHELRTPLTSIIGYLELLGGNEPLGEEDARFVEIVKRNAARLQRMVEELLFLSRLDAGGLELELDAPATLHVRGDAHRLGQVFDNLISNAIKFTPERGCVKVSIGGDGETIVASVSDTGCGIPQAEQSHLFERFFRSSASRDVPGTGLGLTIVRAILEAHEGSIACRSEEGAGTAFTFTLPQRLPVELVAEPAVASAR